MNLKYPYYKEIPYIAPDQVAHLLHQQPYFLWLDSANQQRVCDQNRYSFIAIDPWKVMRWKYGETGDPLLHLQQNFKQYQLATVPELPPFQGGLAGYFGYDLCHYLEDIPTPGIDDMRFPDVIVGYYDVLISFDHHQKKAWIISTGWPAENDKSRTLRAKKRIVELEQLLLAPNDLPEQTAFESLTIESNFTKDHYEKMVQRCIDYIIAGDIFEVNVSQRFTAELPTELTAYQLYTRLREGNPAPFAAYLNFEDTVIASASPERFLQCRDGLVETRPIKGTRPRGKNEAEDKLFSQELLRSEKDCAENIMIVDLMRNDLSRVCQDDSVVVSQLCELESFETVHHLVSVVTGQLHDGKDAFDVLRATFPGGSITGAPKVRVMEIISELEPNRRGPYCGSIGYIGHNGSVDLSIVIRTFAIKNNRITFQAGGAIVYDSDPEQEYFETLDKARALMRALKAEKVGA